MNKNKINKAEIATAIGTIALAVLAFFALFEGVTIFEKAEFIGSIEIYTNAKKCLPEEISLIEGSDIKFVNTIPKSRIIFNITDLENRAIFLGAELTERGDNVEFSTRSLPIGKYYILCNGDKSVLSIRPLEYEIKEKKIAIES